MTGNEFTSQFSVPNQARFPRPDDKQKSSKPLTARFRRTTLNSAAFPPGSIVQIPRLTSVHPAADGIDCKLISWNEAEKRTPFAPALIERMSRLQMIKLQSAKLIERMRGCAQPNRQFRGERLVPSAVNMKSDRLNFAIAVSETAAEFENLPPICDYLCELTDLIGETDKLHETFLRQVMLFCVKPCKAILDEYVVRVCISFSDLEKCRDRYDNARKKSATVDNTIQLKQQQFVDQANELASLLDDMPSQQMIMAKAIDMFIRSESGFCKAVWKLSDCVKQPDHRSRWKDQQAQQ